MAASGGRDEQQTPNTPPGPAVDATGQAVVDPTENVLRLVNAAVQRLDDLRTTEVRHVREMDAMRDRHTRSMREAEAERINAIRAVDVGAVQQAAAVATTQATTLAAQVATSAEAMRTQVAAAAGAATIALAAALEPIQKDIADLRRAQYEAAGQKTQVVESRSSNAAAYAVIGLIVTVVLATVTVVTFVLAN